MKKTLADKIDEMAQATRAFVDRSLAPMKASIEKLETLGERLSRLEGRDDALLKTVERLLAYGGEKGLDGAPGAKGEKGERGEKGLDGAPGAKGEKGERGEKGLDGAPGAKGEKGERGEKGLDGAPGAKGEKGERGEKGLDGAPGAKGEKGERGEKGLDGAPGAKGEKGERGEKGVSVVKSLIDADGCLVLTLSDGAIEKAGIVRGADGRDATDELIRAQIDAATDRAFERALSEAPKPAAGKSVIKARIAADGALVFSMSDGAALNAGSLTDLIDNAVEMALRRREQVEQ